MQTFKNTLVRVGSPIVAALVLGSGIEGTAQAAWETVTVGGLTTEVYTPASMSPVGDGRALMIALHGCTQTADQLETYGNFELVAEDLGIVIALPSVPNGGVIAGCWNYYGALHSREFGDAGALVSLAEGLRDDPAYAIDPAQVYLTGLSSGAGMAIVVGCVAPDIFAGTGIVAGPAVGTASSETVSVSQTADGAAATCSQLAAAHSDGFATQLAIVLADQGDFTVAQAYGPVNVGMYEIEYAGAQGTMTTAAVDVMSLQGSSPAGMGTVYSDADGPRISLLQTTGVGHNWPAGSGADTGLLTFVTGVGINFSYYAGEFFAANTRRAEGAPPDTGTGGETEGGGEETSKGTASSGTSGGGPQGSDEGSSTATGAADSSATGTSGTLPTGGATTPEEEDEDSGGGCRCRSNLGVPPSGLVALLGVLFVRRRRASPRRATARSDESARS